MKRYIPFVIIGAILFIAIGAGLLGLRSAQPTLPMQNAPPTTPPEMDLAHVRGEANAPVTLEEFGDFQCPPCSALYPELKKIEADYGPRLRAIFRQFPITSLHKHALEAAHASEAAGLQGHFWEMHDLLYENQNKWSGADNVRTIFTNFALSLGLNIEDFTRDMDSTRVAKRIIFDQERGTSLKVTGTPTLFINGHQLPTTAMTDDGIRAAIDDALTKK